jgi:hypothetical protein
MGADGEEGEEGTIWVPEGAESGPEGTSDEEGGEEEGSGDEAMAEGDGGSGDDSDAGERGARASRRRVERAPSGRGCAYAARAKGGFG